MKDYYIVLLYREHTNSGVIYAADKDKDTLSVIFVRYPFRIMRDVWERKWKSESTAIKFYVIWTAA